MSSADSEDAEAQQNSCTPRATPGPAGAVADWARAPEVALAAIFSFLPVLDRHNAAQVCSSWQAASSHPAVWHHFDYGVSRPDDTPDQVHQQFQKLSSKHEQHVQVVEAYGDKFLYVHLVLFHAESFDILRKLAEKCRDVKCCVIRVLRSNSPQLLEENRNVVSRFLSTNTSLQEICLRNVNCSSRSEINSPFPIGPAHTRCLRKLSLVNSFRQHNLSALMYLINVTELAVVPHQIRFTWLFHLAKASLRTLNIINMFSIWKFDSHVLPEESWKQIAQSTPLRVNCYTVDVFNCTKLLCHGIPLKTLVCCEFFNLSLKSLHLVITKYAETLTTFIYYSEVKNSYRCQPTAADDHILSLVPNCPKLRTLAVIERLLSSTLLLAVQLNPNLQDPIIRKDMIQYQLRIPEEMFLSQPVQEYVENNFQEDRFVPAMSQLLQRKWCPLPQREYFSLLKARYNPW